MYSHALAQEPAASAGPNQRAGLKLAPVAGPKISTPSASDPPIAAPATPLGAFGLTAVPITPHEHEGADRLGQKGQPEAPALQVRVVDPWCAVSDERAAPEEERLGEQRARDPTERLH